MHPIMEKKLLYAEKDDADKETRKQRLADNGYVFGAHAEEDAVRDKDKRLSITKEMCAQALKFWMMCVLIKYYSRTNIRRLADPSIDSSSSKILKLTRWGQAAQLRTTRSSKNFSAGIYL